MPVVEVIGDSSKLMGGGNAEITRKYSVYGVDTAEEAVLTLRNYLFLTMGNPPVIGSLVLDEISDAEEVEGLYNLTAMWRTFERRPKPAEGESQFNFELGLESVKVSYAVGGIRAYKSPLEQTWVPEKINDQGDGNEVDGVEIFEPIYEESETHWIPTSSITPAYRAALKGVVGRVNSEPFKGWEAGEVLMRGISGTRRGANDSEITFRWAVRENQNDLTLGEVTGIVKKGWEYLWPRYTTRRAFNNAPAKEVISHVAVATVFPTADFSQLDIGTE